MFTWETIAELNSLELLAKLESDKHMMCDYCAIRGDCLPYRGGVFCAMAIDVAIMLAGVKLKTVATLDRIGS